MIPLFRVRMKPQTMILDTLYSGNITQGIRVEEFESKLKELFKHEHALTVNSATSGLTLALRLLRDETGFDNTCDYVLSTPLTCTATNFSILANGYKIKWVDTDLNTCNIDLDDLERKIDKNTKIIMIVHWGGTSIDYDKLNDILERKECELGFRPFVVEDCAHAFMSKFDGRYLGTTIIKNSIAVYSLQAIKHMTTGDGGIMLFPNVTMYRKAKLLRWYGIDRDERNYSPKDFRLERDISEWGYKFHMNDVNASIGLCNLVDIEKDIQIHIDNAKFYNENLKNIKRVTLLRHSEKCQGSYWLYTILVDDAEKFIEFMKSRNITCSQVHKRNDVHSCLQEYRSELPNLNSIENKYVCIPVGWWLKREDLDEIVNSIEMYSHLNALQ